jgi:heptosyltransferase-2
MRKRSRREIDHLVNTKDSAPTPALPLQAHHIYQYLHLTAALGAKADPLPPEIHVTPQAVADFKEKFGVTTASGETPLLFGLNAGAEYGPAKRWPEERFVEAAKQIQKRLSCRWIIFGVKAEHELAARIAAQIPNALNLAGKTSLGELCAGLKFCRVLLTNDSGPMHVAGAVGTAVVVPFGSTSPELTGPGLPGDSRHQLLRANAPCAPCFLRECPIDFRCMTGITVGQVVEAVIRATG